MPRSSPLVRECITNAWKLNHHAAACIEFSAKMLTPRTCETNIRDRRTKVTVFSCNLIYGFVKLQRGQKVLARRHY